MRIDYRGNSIEVEAFPRAGAIKMRENARRLVDPAVAGRIARAARCFLRRNSIRGDEGESHFERHFATSSLVGRSPRVVEKCVRSLLSVRPRSWKISQELADPPPLISRFSPSLFAMSEEKRRFKRFGEGDQRGLPRSRSRFSSLPASPVHRPTANLTIGNESKKITSV